jgi:myo-inositol-1(or 4)-monophosphatase
MSEIGVILDSVKKLVAIIGSSFDKSDKSKEHYFHPDNAREIKANADMILESRLLEGLRSLNIPILSEETGFTGSEGDHELLLIVDPLDGTYNFIRDIEHYGISVALWRKDEPLFGIIFDLPHNRLYWGGKEFGAYCDGLPIQTSGIGTIGEAVICTGFPARLDINDPVEFNQFRSLVTPFGKVRMIGSAALSLIMLSRGSADFYAEKNIMLWDIAAGLAILSGAGGSFILDRSKIEWGYNVRASNGIISAS